MFCPRCGSRNGDEVIFCRGCGLDLVEVRVAIGPGAKQALAAKASFAERVAEGQRKRQMRRTGLDGTESALTLEEKAIEVRSRGIMGLLVGGGFAAVSYVVYSAPPIGGVFWLIPVAFAIFFLAASIGRFVQSSSLFELARREDRPALPESRDDYIKPSRSIYETDELPNQPHSITDATTRHLEAKPIREGEE